MTFEYCVSLLSVNQTTKLKMRLHLHHDDDHFKELIFSSTMMKILLKDAFDRELSVKGAQLFEVNIFRLGHYSLAAGKCFLPCRCVNANLNSK